MAVALGDVRTQAAMSDYRRRSRRAIALGGAALGLAVAIVLMGAGNPPEPFNSVAAAALGLGAVAVLAGAIGIFRGRRVRRRLSDAPWCDRAARYRIVETTGNGQPVLTLLPAPGATLDVYSIAATASRFRRLHTKPNGTVGFVAGGRRWAVVTPPDRSVVMVARRPLLPWWRRRLQKWASEPE